MDTIAGKMLKNYAGTWTCRDMAGRIMLAHGHVETWPFRGLKPEPRNIVKNYAGTWTCRDMAEKC